MGLEEYCLQCRCGAREGCLYPNLLADADGSIGVGFRTCDLKARPVTMSGTTPMPPDTVRTGDMSGWTSGEQHSGYIIGCRPNAVIWQVSEKVDEQHTLWYRMTAPEMRAQSLIAAPLSLAALLTLWAAASLPRLTTLRTYEGPLAIAEAEGCPQAVTHHLA